MRTKNTPTPKQHSMGSVSLSTIGEFIPIYRKKRSKRPLRDKTTSYHQLVLAKETHKQYYLGEIKIGISNSIIAEIIQSCKVCFKSNEDQSSIILSVGNECTVIQESEDAAFFKDLLKTKIFCFEIYSQEQQVFVRIYLQSIPLPKFTSPIGKCILTVFQRFHNLDITDIQNMEVESDKTFTLNELEQVYAKLIEKRDFNEYPPLKQECLAFLKPVLRPYQQEALKWMFYRETQANKSVLDTMHPLYKQITLNSGCNIYLDINDGWVELEPPLVDSHWKGGILADEMGLGKTVEVLALILYHRINNLPNLTPAEDKDLVIISQMKKTKLPSEHLEEVMPAKKAKPSDTPLAENSPRQKSATFVALQSIYNRTLAEYCTTETRVRRPECLVQCICGSIAETDCIKCVECGKLQHSGCLGWNKRLGPYKCPQCWEKSDPIDTKATLIVAPAALRKQWCREMESHLKAGLKVLNYEGYSATPVYPTELQNYDIVITTYMVLQSEMRLTETTQSLSLRNRRKYWPGSSPLVRMRWWRLCLDEAQTVETPRRLVSLMAGKIPAIHRWAVTGTPMTKGLSDIFGLIDYLQMQPYSDFNTWNHILYNPFVSGVTEPMYDFLSKVLWRTSKNSVLNQINIPPQSTEMHVLEFSAVEKFFYQREHEICANDFLVNANKYDPDTFLDKMNKKDFKNLMAPLLALRQACSDPTSVRGKGRYLSLKKNTSSMKDLLDALIARNKSDCEESLRLMISSINGLAGLHLLMQYPEGAVNEYRKVLQLASQFSQAEKEGRLTIDKLLLIHTMHNLAEVLSSFTPKDRTLRDDSLREDCAKVEKQYIEKFMKETASGIDLCAALTNSIITHKKELSGKFGEWYSNGCDWVSSNNLDTDLISRVEIAAEVANVPFDMSIKGKNSRTVLRIVYVWHQDLEESRDRLCDAIKALYEEIPGSKHIQIGHGVVEKAMDCHLRPQKSKKSKKTVRRCAVCLANVKLKDYELKLYTMKKRIQDSEDWSLQGSWKPRLEELILRGLLGLLKSKNFNGTCIQDGETHMRLIESMKKEFKELRKVWTLLDRQICAQDELDICKVRLQLKTGNEKTDSANRTLKNLSYDQPGHCEHINLISPAELPHQELILRSEETRQNSRLEALLGTRNYLGTLRQQQFEGFTPDPCPVCRSPLINTWAILSCAHTYCMDCFQTLFAKAETKIQCCVCRAKHNLQDVAYINNRLGSESKNDPLDESETIVVGSYSRKVDAVLRLLLKLRKSDPNVKVLLFSAWSQVLKLLKTALEQNDINVELADATTSFEKRIETFKDPFQKITVLLLPIRLGSKGLNLIEATHVILLEPLLNPADELQAIGRVHRIGQTKPTVVYKFLISNTIEESVHNATSSNTSGWEKGKVTVGQLKSLFANSFEDVNESQEEASTSEITTTQIVEVPDNPLVETDTGSGSAEGRE
ncbi:E3 ubiquitin-protein ligase SHPRH isoform X1 [Euwallacea fornicatus]|uniref:E3 ubiquitin-protein ligase SHPRH isoform X1 n=1 Tax=Euwallacea fornicatus TaxID=995702 RepID=UPI00338F4702